MKILVANLGSTSFKYRLFDMAGGRAACRAADRTDRLAGEPLHGRDRRPAAGEDAPRARSCRSGSPVPCPIDRPASRLPQSGVGSVGHRLQGGPRRAHQRRAAGHADVLAAMEEMNQVAPAHNPPYITAMRLLGEKLPEIPLVAAFETDFHQHHSRRATATTPCRTIGPKTGLIRRYGFHGASHRYIATRTAELLGPRLANHFLPPRRIEFALRHPRRPERGHEHGLQPAKRPAAEQPRGRFRSLRPADDDGTAPASRSTKCCRSVGQPERAAGPQRRQRRPARHRRGRRGRQRPGEAGPRRVSPPTCGITWAPIWSNWAAPTRSCSPAASARTGPDSARPSAAIWSELGIVLDPAGQRIGQGRSRDQRRRRAACRFGSFPPTRN